MPLKWYHLHIWGCWYFSPQSQFQLVLYSLTFRMMYPAHQLNKQGDNIHPFPILNQFIFSCPVLTVASWPANRFLKEAGNVVWYSHLIKNILQFVVIHTVKGSSIVSEAEVDFFLLEFPCFFYDPVYVGNLISGFSAFSKSSLYIWKFTVHVLLKPSLKDFDYYLANVLNECNYMVIWIFFGIAFFWDLNENWTFPGLWPLQVFQICWRNECNTITASSFRIWNSPAGIPSSPLALFVVKVPKSPLTSHSSMSGSWWVTTPLWLSGSCRSFFVKFFCVFLPPFLNLFCFC